MSKSSEPKSSHLPFYGSYFLDTTSTKGTLYSIVTILLVAFAVLLWGSKAGVNITTTLLFLAMLFGISGRTLRGYHHDPLLQAAVLLGAYLILNAGWGMVIYPDPGSDEATKHLELAFQIFRGPLVMVAIAWAISASGIRGRTLALAFIFGLFASIPIAFYWYDVNFWPLLQGRRSPLNFGTHANDLGLFAGVALAFLLFLRPRQFLEQGEKGWLRHMTKVIWLAGVFLALAMLLIAQSRGAWLAVAVALPAFAIIELFIQKKNKDPSKKENHTAFWILTTIAIIAVALFFSDLIYERFAKASEAFHILLAGNLGQVPWSSFGLRIHMWQIGLNHWWEHPFLGNGPASGNFILQNSNIPQLSHRIHMHSLYIDTLVRTGLIGLALFFLIFYIAFSALAKAVRNNPETRPFALALAASLTIFLIHGGAQFLLTGNRPSLLLAFLGGWAYSLNSQNPKAYRPQTRGDSEESRYREGASPTSKAESKDHQPISFET